MCGYESLMGHEIEPDPQAHMGLLRRCFTVLSDIEEEHGPEAVYLGDDPDLLRDLGAAVAAGFDGRFPPRAAAPGSDDPPLPERSSTKLRLPPPGRRGAETLAQEDRALALMVKRAAGEWVELDLNGRTKGYERQNWVSKFHGGSRAFPRGEFRATNRNGRLFVRFVG